MRAEVIAIGDELITGQRLDTNSRWISDQLGLLGIPVLYHTTVGDTLEAGVEVFGIATGRCDLVIATGGLGPTADDLTRDVLAAVSGGALELSEPAVRAIEERFARRGVAMPESNRRQALFPVGSRIIRNRDGTAPGIDIDIPRAGGRTSRVIALPGVPAEMRAMWQDTVVAALLEMQPGAGTMVHRRIKCFGAGESAIEAMLPDIIRRGREPLVGITVHEATITLRIVAHGRDEGVCRATIAPTERLIRESLGHLVFGEEDDELEDAAVRALASSGQTLATCEIGTEGRVAAALSQAAVRADGGVAPREHATAARGFLGGTVLAAGVVSGPDRDVAMLAERARRTHGAGLGLAVGPVERADDGRDAVTIVLADGQRTERLEHMLGGGSGVALARAAKTAIDLVRRRILFPTAST